MSPSPSLLRRIARHGVTELRNRREDRLTEIFAAVLAHRRCPGLARHVALGWLEQASHRVVGRAREHHRALHALLTIDDAWRCAVATQVGFDSETARRRPDLELRFRPDEHELLVWIEVKHGSPPHTGQLQAYADEQSHRGVRHATVLLLAPRADYRTFPSDEIPDAVPRLSWEQTAGLIRSFPVSDPVGAFLRDELLAYLQEEELMDPQCLNPELIHALTVHRRAADALHAVCALTADALTSLGHGTPDASHWPRHSPREYWWSYADADVPRPASPDGLDWNWQLLLDSADVLLNGRPGVPCLLAGVTGPAGTIRRLSPEARAALRQAGFDVLGVSDSNSSEWEYLVRVTYAQDWPDLVRGDSIETQAQALATWVDETFRSAAGALATLPRRPSDPSLP